MEEDRAQAFLNWLTATIQERQITEHHLAKKADIGHSMFYRLRSHGVIPSWDICYKLAKALDVSVYETFRMAGLIPALSDFKQRERMDRAIEKISQVPDDRLDFVFGLIDLVIKDSEKPKR